MTKNLTVSSNDFECSMLEGGYCLGEGLVYSLSEHCCTVLHALYMGFSGTKNNLKPLNLFVHYFLQIFNQLFKSTVKYMSSSKDISIHCI